MINAETDGELVKNAVRYEDTLKKHLNKEISHKQKKARRLF